jgi:hypothetical protein
MKYLVGIAVIVFSFGMGLAQTSLDNIILSKAGDTVLVDIIVSRPCQYDHSITVTAPERIYVDLKNTVVNWVQKNYNSLPLKTFKGIRVGQNQTTPELIARVVINIGRRVTYQVQDIPSGIRIKIPAIAGETAFASWQAQGSKRLAETEVKQAPKPISAKTDAVTTKKTALAVAKIDDKPIKDDKSAKTEQLASKKDSKETKQLLPVVKEQPKVEKKEAIAITPAKVEKPKEAANIPPPAIDKPIELPKTAAVSTVVAKEPVREKPAKLGTEMEAMPQREAVEYVAATDRDPFKSLIGQNGAQISANKLPAIENLTLVGILEDNGGNQALFEDAEGNGYILHPNDIVRNGILMSVQKEKAVFSITEYGWTRTVTLNLKLPELK